MSRSLGLREDQRLGEVLAQRIGGLFPVDLLWLDRRPAPDGQRPPATNGVTPQAGWQASRGVD
jgi:hypothetical protein